MDKQRRESYKRATVLYPINTHRHTHTVTHTNLNELHKAAKQRDAAAASSLRMTLKCTRQTDRLTEKPKDSTDRECILLYDSLYMVYTGTTYIICFALHFIFKLMYG